MSGNTFVGFFIPQIHDYQTKNCSQPESGGGQNLQETKKLFQTDKNIPKLLEITEEFQEQEQDNIVVHEKGNSKDAKRE